MKFIDDFLGALFFWIIKGFKTSLDEEMDEKHRFRNVITTLIILFILLFYVFKE